MPPTDPAAPAAHPAPGLFPLLDDAELRVLADDIKAHGLLHPIARDASGLILDGRNRLRACKLAGVEPTYETWRGEGSPAAWIVSQNLHRRHLTVSQRAMMGAGLVPLFAAEAKERGRDHAGKFARTNEESTPGRARDKAAEAVKVSPRALEDAVTVTERAPPEVVEAVKAGKTAVSAAAKATRKPKKDKDWKSSLTIIVPHSALSSVIRALRKMGFKGGGGSSRKMRLGKIADLHAT
jgi:hypothetical protein